MTPAPPSFPFVGVMTPILFGLGLWAILGSPFALVGAILGPAMVLAHYGDAIRRARRDQQATERQKLSERANRRRVKLAKLEVERQAANTSHPSLAQIHENPFWTPSHNGQTEIRAGSVSRDGVPGFPWLIDIRAGVAVVGEGLAADSVWRSLLVHGTAAHGVAESSSSHVSWPSGPWVHRGEHDSAASTIRCIGTRIVNVTRRGSLPETGDWEIDDAGPWEAVLTRCAPGRSSLHWADRQSCETGIGMANGVPFFLDVNSVTPHIAVCGRTGSGKSVFLAALLGDWAERFSPNELSWVGIDFKGGATLQPLADLIQCRGVVSDLEADLVHRALAGISREITDREQQFRQEGVSRIEDSAKVGRLVVVVDEFPELVRRFPHALEVLADIARRGRSLGIHLVLATQHTHAFQRDGLGANIPVRVVFPLHTALDVSSVLGTTPQSMPTIGRPIVSMGDGSQSTVVVRGGAEADAIRETPGDRLAPLWLPPLKTPLIRPVGGGVGFGKIDDPVERSHHPAIWTQRDGDIVVVGRRGSGKSTAVRALVGESQVTWADSLDDIARAAGLVIVDNLDRLHDLLPDSRKHELAALITSRRLEPHPPIFVFSVSNWTPRLHGLVPNVLVLATNTRDAHLATGESAETFDPSAEPGVGSWRGRRVIVYASTDSMVTESIP